MGTDSHGPRRSDGDPAALQIAAGAPAPPRRHSRASARLSRPRTSDRKGATTLRSNACPATPDTGSSEAPSLGRASPLWSARHINNNQVGSSRVGSHRGISQQPQALTSSRPETSRFPQGQQERSLQSAGQDSSVVAMASLRVVSRSISPSTSAMRA
jgi:hypothetical protein